MAMDLHAIRLANLRRLMAERNIEADEIASDWETSPAYLRQILGGKHAKIGINLASRIEGESGLPLGWLSQEHGSEGIPTKEDAIRQIKEVAETLSTGDLVQMATFLLDIVKTRGT